MYLSPTDDQGRDLLMRRIEGPVTMLNLLRFRDDADYSESPALAPTPPISGRDAYERYKAHTAPFLAAEGGDVLYEGEGAGWFIGPDERCDLVLLVRPAGVGAFLAMAMNGAYPTGMGHRSAAIADSRLLPLVGV